MNSEMATKRRGGAPMAFWVALAVGAAAGGGPALGQQVFETSAGPVTAEIVASGLVHPWALGFLPDGGLLVTERPGRLRIVRNGVVGAPVVGVPEVWARGQGGLLDIALGPDFAASGRVYVSYAKPGPGGAGTAVMAATLQIEGMNGRLVDQRVIFEMDRSTPNRIQFGSRIAIARDGNLFVTLGDRGDADRAQDADDLAGGVVRIGPDGSIPADNPFVGRAGADALWSIGHRNPQGATIRASDGSLWTVEHGAMGGDEINKEERGRNYGWPVISYGQHYGGGQIGIGTAAPGMEQPVYYWDPSIAPSGLSFYEGEMFPQWRGDLLVGALKFELVARLEMDGDRVVGEERLFKGAFGRIRDVRVGPDGAIWLVTDEDPGAIIRITPGRRRETKTAPRRAPDGLTRRWPIRPG